MNYSVKDSFMSNTGVFYRCIPHAVTGISENNVWENTGGEIFPNPCHGEFKVVFPAHTTSMVIVDISGRLIYELKTSGQPDADLSIDAAGIYFFRFIGTYGTCRKKLIVSSK
jgi:hypothetical protein